MTSSDLHVRTNCVYITGRCTHNTGIRIAMSRAIAVTKAEADLDRDRCKRRREESTKNSNKRSSARVFSAGRASNLTESLLLHSNNNDNNNNVIRSLTMPRNLAMERAAAPNCGNLSRSDLEIDKRDDSRLSSPRELRAARVRESREVALARASDIS